MHDIRLTQSSLPSSFSFQCIAPSGSAHCSIGMTKMSLCRFVLLRLNMGISTALGSGSRPAVVPCSGRISGWAHMSISEVRSEMNVFFLPACGIGRASRVAGSGGGAW